MRQLLETVVKLMASVESNKNTVNNSQEKTLEVILKKLDTDSYNQMQEIKKTTNKNITFGS